MKSVHKPSCLVFLEHARRLFAPTRHGRIWRETWGSMISEEKERLGVNGEGWLETVRHFGRWFERAAGRRDSLESAATQAGGGRFQGRCSAKLAFR